MPSKPTALITGGSGGIGLALAKCFAIDGYRIILVARQSSRLTKAAAGLKKNGAEVITVGTDLGRPNAAEHLKRQLDRKKVSVDVLVNNAGFGLRGPFVATSPKRESELLAVNIVTLTELCKLYAPEMAARGAGRILNVASLAAFLPGPLMVTYYASKAYVRSFSWALAEELEPMGVSVTVLCPGPTKTDFAKTASAGQTNLYRRPASVEQVAKAGYRGLMKGRRQVVVGLGGRIFTWALRLIPTRTAARFALRSDS